MTTQKYEICARFEVVEFANFMESTLKQHDHKGHWKNCNPEYLSRKLTEEFSELQSELIHTMKDNDFDSIKAARIRDECIDLANVCMMIADNSFRRWLP